MLHIISYIISSVIASVVSCALLIGIPFGVLLEMKGLGTYMYALTIVIASVFELIYFLFLMFTSGDVEFSIKGLFQKIKSLFKKEKKNINKKDKNVKENKTSRDKIIYIVESIILIVIAVYCVINPQHSSVTNVIYNGLFVKILAGIIMPLIIINTVNQIILEHDGLFAGLGTQFNLALASFVFGFVIATGMLFTASIWYQDIETNIKKSWFIYDNPNFDEIRGADFNSDEYIKSEYQKLDDKYKQSMTCNINEEQCMKELKLSIVREVDNRNAEIRNYGYMYKSRIEVDTNTDVLCITDMKTTHNLFYRINYRDFSFDVITIDEYNSYAGA